MHKIQHLPLGPRMPILSCLWDGVECSNGRSKLLLELRRDDCVRFGHIPGVDADKVGDFVKAGFVLELSEAVFGRPWGQVKVPVGESPANPFFSDFLVEYLQHM